MRLALMLDLDGTVFDTFPQILDAMNLAAEEEGIRPFGSSELRPLIGTSISHQLDVLRDERGPVVERLGGSYYRHFRALIEKDLRLYPGVREGLGRLAARRIGTMSTRRVEVAERMLDLAGVRDRFTAVVGGDQVSNPKPAPDLPRLSARALGVPTGECVAIGDAPVDVLAGRAAGARTVAVLYGYGDPRLLRDAGPDAEIGSFDELPAVLDLWESG